MAKEYIEREEAAKAFDELLLSPYAEGKSGCFSDGVRDALKLARDMMRNKVPESLSIPAANVRENVPGEWKQRRDERNGSLVTDEWYGPICFCSLCGEEMLGTPKFCPGCGADMRGAQDG